MMASRSAKSAAVAIVAAMLLLAAPSHAEQDPAEQASAAYRRGQAASSRRDYLEAARAFAEADSILANPVALESAIKASILADDPAMGMQLAERAHRGAAYAALSVVQEAFEKFRNRVGKIEINCDTAALCEATVDGAALPGKDGWFAIGTHTVSLRAGDRSHQETVTLEGGGRVEVKMPPAAVAAPVAAPAVFPPAAVAPREPEPIDQGVDGGTVVFWTGVGLTGALTAGAFVSLADLVSKHGDFADACENAVGPVPTCAELASDGEAAQTRTWILGGAAMGFAVVTGIVGVTVVEWSDSKSVASLRLRVAPAGFAFEGAL